MGIVMRKWIQTPDGIKSDGVEIKYSNPNAFPLFITYRFGTLCGENGNSHAAVTGNDKEQLALIKAIRLMKTEPNIIDDEFDDIDFSDCNSNIDKARKISKEIVNDIYAEGRCFDLTEEYNQIIFTFWDANLEIIPIVTDVCSEQGLDDRIVFVAEPEENSSYLSTPDMISVNGRKYSFRNKNATAFTVLFNPIKKNMTVEFAEPGEMHKTIQKRIEPILSRYDSNITYEKLVIVEGRFWNLLDECDMVVFSFWAEKRQVDEKKIMEFVSKKYGFDFSKVYYTHLDELINASSNEPYKKNSQETLNKMKAIHMLSAKDKWDSTKNFRDVVQNKWDDEHRNDDGSVPTRAEYHAMLPFRESVEKETIEKVPTTLYHGTPHLFNHFSMSKVNTGQHSQDFGLGLYFTTDKETAVFYANELSHKMSAMDKYEMVFSKEPDDILKNYLEQDYTVSAKRVVRSKIANNDIDSEKYVKLLSLLDKTMRYAYIYTVKINNPNYIDRDEYIQIQKENNFSDEQMNLYLKKHGYNGIIYDMNTRGCSDKDFSGEKNIVIIDDSIIHIEQIERKEFEGIMKLNI